MCPGHPGGSEWDMGAGRKEYTGQCPLCATLCARSFTYMAFPNPQQPSWGAMLSHAKDEQRGAQQGSVMWPTSRSS